MSRIRVCATHLAEYAVEAGAGPFWRLSRGAAAYRRFFDSTNATVQPSRAPGVSKKAGRCAEERTHHSVRYDPAYVRIPYPGGDVSEDTGVCTDEVIRSYRAVGVDLQKEVHEDMEKNFSAYPRQRRSLARRPDRNIDHRRVPNLMVFFSRKGESLTITEDPADYSPGDIVTWDLGGEVPHIGIVVNEKSAEGARHLMVHNIGQGPTREDVLFVWKITGHYRYYRPGS